MSTLLLVTIFLPLAGALALSLVASKGRNAVRAVALLVTLVTLAAAGFLVSEFPADGVGEYAVTEVPWISPDAAGNSGQTGASLASWVPDIRFSVGLDGLGVWLFGLSALLMVTAVLVSWEAITERPALFYAMLLILESGCLGVFAARDLLLFYIFFEFTLIPLFFLIGIWGSEDRRYAAVKFFLFTLAGSVLTFLGLIALVFWDSKHGGQGVLRFSISALTHGLHEHPLPFTWQLWVFLALFAGFAIKVPLFPLHTWLPLAHVQAPTAGSVFLAGVLLKIGTYGFARFSIPLLPEASAYFMPWILWLSVAGIVYGALVALVQQDMKRLIAYSSVSHLGFCMLGLFAFNQLGMQGGVLQMINHGLSTGGLFAVVGMLYERYHTRDIAKLGGLARKLPWLTTFMLLFTFSSIGLPGMNGFVGEFMILAGMFQRAFAESTGPGTEQLRWISVLSVSGVVLGAWYMLWLVQRVFFGPLKEVHDGGHGGDSAGAHGGAHGDGTDTPDLKWREVLALAPLLVFVFWIGLQPGYFLRRIAPALENTTQVMAGPLHNVARIAPNAPTPTAAVATPVTRGVETTVEANSLVARNSEGN